eukprot:2660356-Amphidinium_carterae.2
MPGEVIQKYVDASPQGAHCNNCTSSARFGEGLSSEKPSLLICPLQGTKAKHRQKSVHGDEVAGLGDCCAKVGCARAGPQ